jgi:hypothetical protein
MDKKKILIGIGVLAVVGIAIYFINKNKKSASVNADTTDASTSDASTTKSTSADAPTEPAKATLEKRKEKRKACGRKPLNKEKRAEWQKCVDAGGSVSFEGDFDEFQDDYMD